MFNINIERALISSIIFEPTILEQFIKNDVKAKDFYLPAHQQFYGAILSLNKKDSMIDEEFIKKECKDYDETALLDVIATYPLSNAVSYIEELKNLSSKRHLVDLSHAIKKSALEDDGIEAEAKAKELFENMENSSRVSLFEEFDINDVEAKKCEFYLENWMPIPKRTVSIVSAPGGTGKSWTILQLAIRFLKDNPNEKAFLWLSEDPKELTKERANLINESILRDYQGLEKYRNRLTITDSETLQVLEEYEKGHRINPKWFQLRSNLKKYDLIVLDPLIAFYGGDENSNGQARKFMQQFTQFCTKENKTLIFIHHSKKVTKEDIGSKTRGAGALVDAVRAVYEIEKIDNETSKRKIRLTKDNYGASKLFGGFEKDLEITPRYEIERTETPKDF
ncbi:MAG: AAA family ATPase [Campylobacterales bacterium]|nr:AAA family ATPase [Campylobacterales bacterium]